MHKIIAILVVASMFLIGTYSSASKATTVTVQEQVKVLVKVKSFKLYGLDCTKCYLAIVRKVGNLKGVVGVRFYRDSKTLVIRGIGYDMNEVKRIVESEKQRIVG